MSAEARSARPTTAALRVGLFGAGRLGSAIAAAAGDTLAWQVARNTPPDVPVDVAIEASSGAAVEARLAWALESGTPLVIGSTGWAIDDLEARVGARIGVVVAPNFSLSVALMRRLATVLGRFAALDAARDPYLVEQHHARKADAPSGTARLLADTLLEACPRKARWTIGGPVAPDELSVAVIRAGTTYSSHTIGVDAPEEVLHVQHEARSGAAYAAGALTAARWVRGRRGVFPFDAVSADVLDPLFVGLAGAGYAGGAR
ncbi:MAG: dihydrodipicolinate reductase C-terminal domain-containing protein [Planctomycetota bacterium]